MAPLDPVTDHTDFQTLIRFFQKTVRGFYGNMTLSECIKKSAPTDQQESQLRRLWLKKGGVQWQDGGAGAIKTMLLTMAFHRRDLFNETVSDAPHYYLSVGLSDVTLTIDGGTGTEYDPNLTVDCAKEIVKKINETCKYFVDNEMPGAFQNRLYIALHTKLRLDQSRLGEVYKQAIIAGHIESSQQERERVRGVWPKLIERKLILY